MNQEYDEIRRTGVGKEVQIVSQFEIDDKQYIFTTTIEMNQDYQENQAFSMKETKIMEMKNE